MNSRPGVTEAQKKARKDSLLERGKKIELNHEVVQEVGSSEEGSEEEPAVEVSDTGSSNDDSSEDIESKLDRAERKLMDSSVVTTAAHSEKVNESTGNGDESDDAGNKWRLE